MKAEALYESVPYVSRRHPGRSGEAHPAALPEEAVVLEIMPVIRHRFGLAWQFLDDKALERFEKTLEKAAKRALAAK